MDKLNGYDITEAGDPLWDKSCYPLNSLIAILVEMGNFNQQSEPFLCLRIVQL